MEILEVIDYIKSLGFVEQPCSLPLDDFNAFKGEIYSHIKDKYPKVYKFLSKISPVKYRKVRLDWALWFKKDKYEICMKPMKGFNSYDGWYSYDSQLITDKSQPDMPYLEQVKDMKDWMIKYYSDSLPKYNFSPPPAWWKATLGSPYEIPFNINTTDDPDGINLWSIYDPIEDNVEKYLKCFPELEGVILQVKRERKLNELI
jgi:hypothetical protein